MNGFHSTSDTPAVIVHAHRTEYDARGAAFAPDPAPPPAAPDPGRFVCERPDGETAYLTRYGPDHFPGPGHGDERYSRHVVQVPGGLAVIDDADGALVCIVAADAAGAVTEWQAHDVWGVLAARRLAEAADDAAADLRVLAGRDGVSAGAETECLRLADRLYLLGQAARHPRHRDKPGDVPDGGPERERHSLDNPERVLPEYDRTHFPRPGHDTSGAYGGAGVVRDGAFLVVYDRKGERAFYIRAPYGTVDRERADAVYQYLGAGVLDKAAAGALDTLGELAALPVTPPAVRAGLEGVRAGLKAGRAAVLPPWRRPKVEPAVT